MLTHQIKDNIDILKISGTKLNESFPTSQFSVNGFSSLHHCDRNCNGGGILLYIREDIQSKLLSIKGDLTKVFLVAINLRNEKISLISYSYNPNRASIANHTSALSKSTDIYTSSMAVLYL